MSTATIAIAPQVLADAIPRSRARDAGLVLGAVLLTALCAQVVIPLPGSPVPLTGQTFAVLLTGASLGAARGATAQALYVAVGIVGLPVYADRGAGIDVLFGSTGGYVVGFVVAAWLVGRLAEARLDRSPGRSWIVFALGSAGIYAIAVPWLAIATGMSLGQAVSAGLTPFLLGDLIKAVAAAALLPAAWRLVR